MNANKQQFCGIVGWTSRDFDRYVNLGCFLHTRRRALAAIFGNRYIAGIQWIIERTVTEAMAALAVDDTTELDGDNAALEDKDRAIKAKADILEMNAARMRGNMPR